MSTATIVKSLPALDVWKAMKEVLRRQLGPIAWELWIRNTLLMRVMGEGTDQATLLIALPRNSASITEGQKQVAVMRRLARRMNYHLAITIQPDQAQLDRWEQEKGEPLKYVEGK